MVYLAATLDWLAMVASRVTRPHRLRGLARLTLLLGLYLGLTTWLSWPLVANLGTALPCVTVVTYRFDPIYVIWALSYETHALGTAASRLFDANIYHPTPSALLYGPAAFGALPYFAPTFALTGNPILAINILFLVAVTATAFALHLVAAAWTGAATAGFVAAWVFLTNGWIWGWAPSAPHYAVLLYLPVIVFLAARPLSARRAVLLVVIVSLQSLTEPVYVAPAVFGPLMLLAIGRLVRRRTAASGAALLAVLLASALLLLPLYSGYARVGAANPALFAQSLWWFTRFIPTFHTMRVSAAGLSGNGTTDASWLLLGLILAGGGAAALGRHRIHQTRGVWCHALLWTAVGLLLSTPTLVLFDRVHLELPFYALLERALPSLAAAVRIPNRLGVTSLIGFALLAGLSVDACGKAAAAWTRSWVAPAVRVVLAAILGAALYGQLRAGVPRLVLWPGPEVNTAALEAIRQGRGPLLEVPVGEGVSPLTPTPNARAMFQSIFHWRPLLNGYSSYSRPSSRSGWHSRAAFRTRKRSRPSCGRPGSRPSWSTSTTSLMRIASAGWRRRGIAAIYA